MTTFAVPVGRGTDRLAGYPAWARELDARLPVSPQIVVNGNVEDLHLVAGLPLWTTARTIGGILLANGFAAVAVWDVVRGVSALPGSREDVLPRVLGERVPEGRPSAQGLAELMRRVAHANAASRVRIGLVVDGAPRLAPDATDPHVHALYVGARDLVRTAPRTAVPGDPRPGLYNSVVWIVDHEADLPNWLVGSDAVPVVSLPLPELGARTAVAELLVEDLPGYYDLSQPDRAAASRTLAEQTQGMPLAALRSSVSLAVDRGVPATAVPDAVRLLRSGLQTSPWRDPQLRHAIATAAPVLSDRVIDQPQAVRTVVDVLSRAALGLSGAQSDGHPSRPQGVMFFAGPTGVGKTELAKQIAKVVFGREEAMQRFDMSEFAAEHSEARLIGAPPGYVGHGSGGELTNAVRQQPFSLLLFDEIEKAHPRILDKFLQILEDGRLTDGSGSTVHFTETLIVFTSNLGIYRTEGDQQIPIVAPGEPYKDVERRVRAAVRQAFTDPPIKRPELLNRIGDNIVVFDFISPAGACSILTKNLDSVAQAVASRTGIQVVLTTELRQQLAEVAVEPENLAFGGRRVGMIIESHLINPLARELIGVTAPAVVEVRGWSERDGFHHLEMARRGG